MDGPFSFQRGLFEGAFKGGGLLAETKQRWPNTLNTRPINFITAKFYVQWAQFFVLCRLMGAGACKMFALREFLHGIIFLITTILLIVILPSFLDDEIAPVNGPYPANQEECRQKLQHAHKQMSL